MAGRSWLVVLGSGLVAFVGAPGVSQEDAGASLMPWAVANRALLFTSAAGKAWSAGRDGEREAIPIDRVNERLFRTLPLADLNAAMQRGTVLAGSPALAAAQHSQTMRTWRDPLLPAWLPPAELVAPYSVEQRSGNRWLFRCAATRPGFANVLYRHVTGRGHWFYFEQPDPLPPGQTALTPEDVFRPEFLAAQRAQLTTGESAPGSLMVRTLFRRRGFDPLGPFEPVRILFCHVTLAETLDLRAPGYP